MNTSLRYAKIKAEMEKQYPSRDGIKVETSFNKSNKYTKVVLIIFPKFVHRRFIDDSHILIKRPLSKTVLYQGHVDEVYAQIETKKILNELGYE